MMFHEYAEQSERVERGPTCVRSRPVPVMTARGNIVGQVQSSRGTLCACFPLTRHTHTTATSAHAHVPETDAAAANAETCTSCARTTSYQGDAARARAHTHTHPHCEEVRMCEYRCAQTKLLPLTLAMARETLLRNISHFRHFFSKPPNDWDFLMSFSAV